MSETDSYGIIVKYGNESWKTKGLTIRLSLFRTLQQTNPTKLVTIVSTRDKSQEKKVTIRELELD